LFKVIKPNDYNGSLTGGYSQFNYKPYLPTEGKPGKWMSIRSDRKLQMCQTGFHVTNKPEYWGGDDKNNTVYLVEVEGEFLGRPNDSSYDHKICCRKIRLVKEVKKLAGGKWGTPKSFTEQEVRTLIANVKNQCVNAIDAAINNAFKTT
jgi:hypothetical protein